MINQNSGNEYIVNRFAGAPEDSKTIHAADLRHREGRSPGSPAAHCQAAIVTLKLIAALRITEVVTATAAYRKAKGDLSESLQRLVAEQSCTMPFSSHMVINGDSHIDNEKLFHTMAHHFRKIMRRNGSHISWMKFRCFSEQGKSHLHVILFHDVPLYKQFRRQGDNKEYDLPQFSNPADRLRRVYGRTDTCFRSYNYKLNIKEHDNPVLLAGEYFLEPRNFWPDLVSKSQTRWFSPSRDIVHRRHVMPLFNELNRIIGSLERVFIRRGMEALAGAAVDAVVRGNTDMLKQIIIAWGCTIAAARDRTVSQIPGASILVPAPVCTRGAGAVRRPRRKQPP